MTGDEPTDIAPASAPPLVTMTGLYGTGVSVVGPRVAERLRVSFLDRAVLVGCAERLGMPAEALESYDPETEQEPRSRLARFLDSLGQPATADTSPPPETMSRRLRSATEDYLTGVIARGGVIAGRGGMVALRRSPGALHVRLDGTREARLQQAMRGSGLDRRGTERLLKLNDRQRIGYVQEAYGVHLDDAGLYHLRLDSTVLDVETCVDMVVAASVARRRQLTGTGTASQGPA